ncbi:ankyrin repeat and SAM domain-containing protein 1A-like isoform X3 [Branchiostoma lanceolatum]|uniref:ankyrin repeat and SAM domain-containing protein 1A-like isoform X1 n=3 Tax=Branchiostoma lanceolatum TaxID=7740 RepID=UPI003453B1A6
MPREQELLEAARLGNIAVIEKLLAPKAKRSPVSLQALASLRRGTNPNCQDNTGYTPLHHAALNGHREVVALLLNYGASANLADSKGSYPLHLAAWTGNADIVRSLILHGPSHAKVNERNKDSETPLHFAAQYGHTAVVKVLLEHHADPTMRNKRGESPLDLACLYGRLDTVELLLRKHPTLLDRPGGQSTPLHLASRNGHKPVVQVLLEAGIDVNKTTENGSALHEAALCGKVDIVRLLLDCGVDPLIQDKSAQTVLDLLAGIPKASEITKLIKDHMNKLCLPIGSLDSARDAVTDSSPEQVQSPYDNVPQPLPSPYHNLGDDDGVPGPPPRTLSSSDDENLYDEPPIELFRGREDKQVEERHSGSSSGSAYELLSEAMSGQPRRSLVFKFDQSPTSDGGASTPLSPTGYSQPPTPDHPPPSANTAENTIHQRFFPLPGNGKLQERASGNAGTVTDGHRDIPAQGSYEQTEQSDTSRHEDSVAMGRSEVTEGTDGSQPLDRHKNNGAKDSLAPPEVSPVWKRLSQEEAKQKLKETLAKKQAQKAADSRERTDGDEGDTVEESEKEKLGLNLAEENSLAQIPEEAPTNQGSPRKEAVPASGLTPSDLSSASSSTSFENIPGHQWDSTSESASSRSGSRSETVENLAELSRTTERSDSEIPDDKSAVSLQISRVGLNAESDRSEAEGQVVGHRLSEGELQDTTLTDLTSVTSMDSLSALSSPAAEDLAVAAETVAMETVATETNSVHVEKTMVVEYRPESAEIVRRRGAGAAEGEILPASTEKLLQDLQPFAALCHGSNPKTQSRVSSILYESVLKQEMANEDSESELTSTEDRDSASSDASPFPSPSPSSPSMPDFDAIITETAELNADSNGAREREDSGFEQPVDETAEWDQIANIMSSFGGGLVRESFYSAKLEGNFQQLIRGVSNPRTVGEWLQLLDLQQYENVFVSHGFDNLKFMGGSILEDQDLVEMGVVDPAHREAILSATASLPTLLPMGEGEGEHHSPVPESIEEWLESLELLEYGEYFTKHGVISMERVRKMWEVELNVLEITTLGHRKRILASIGERERDEMPEEMSPEETTVWSTSPLSKTATESLPSPPPSPIQEVDLFKDYTNVKSKYQPTVPPRPTSGGNTSPRPPIPPKPSRRQAPLPAEDPELVLRAPNEATTTAPIRSWRHTPDVLIKGHCNYMAHYLGSMLVTDVRGTVSTKQACAKMKKSTEQMQKVPTIILSISYKGVKFIDAKSKMMVSEHEIRNISCAAQDANDLHVFAYITKDMKTGKHYCHVFSVNSQDLGYEIILTLGQAFEIAFQMIQREKAKRSALAMERQLSSGSDRSAKWSTSSQGSQGSQFPCSVPSPSPPNGSQQVGRSVEVLHYDDAGGSARVCRPEHVQDVKKRRLGFATKPGRKAVLCYRCTML